MTRFNAVGRPVPWLVTASPRRAALALAAGAWGYAHADNFPDGESVAASLRQGGLSVLDYYLGGEE